VTILPFNNDWQVQRDSDLLSVPVTLPHDAMMWEGRSAEAPSGSHEAHFLGGTYRYSKTWFAPLDLTDKLVSLVFEGVYHHCRVLLNGADIGGASSGYTEFEVRFSDALILGAENIIEVMVDNRQLPNSRWYSGSGLYRPVWLRIVEPIHIEHHGIEFHTLSVSDPAFVSIKVHMANPVSELVDVRTCIVREGVTAAAGTSQGIFSASLSLEIPSPELWSADCPALYECTVQIYANEVLRDEQMIKVGLRTIEIDGRNGLRVNGEPTLLRGGNVHHDNGILGAATFRDAEFRRIRILKKTGFNAIRSAHNPASRDLLDACDGLGMYVMDELFDGWYDHKTEHDDAPLFEQNWRREADAMVARDRVHPSVIMYSIGNENSEPVSAFGIETARRLVQRVRQLDPHRPVTIGVNLMSAALGWPKKRRGSNFEQPASLQAPNMNSTMINAVTNQFARLMKLVPRLKRTDVVTRELFDLVDVAGYNYGTVRYERDAILHPERAIVGTETVSGDIAETWAMVEKVPNVIGDFMWSAWDYLGEAGIGTWEYDAPRARLLKPYPHIIAGCGVVDITGTPGAAALHAQAAWGTLDRPAITVRPLDVTGKKIRRTAWRGTDAVSSWAWRGRSGQLAEIDVVSDAEEVELLLNGLSLGRRPAGRAHRHFARFRTRYRPGEITAIAYRGGGECGRSTLRSADVPRLILSLENSQLTANGQSLAFIRIELADEAGVVEMLDDDLVSLSLEGPAILAGLGSAAPASELSYLDTICRTYRGRALAIVRASEKPGNIIITASSCRHGDASVTLMQKAAQAADTFIVPKHKAKADD